MRRRGAALTPRFHGILEDGRLLDPMGAEPASPAADRVLAALRRDGALVLKPLTGGGRGIMMLRQGDGGITCNGAAMRGGTARLRLRAATTT